MKSLEEIEIKNIYVLKDDGILWSFDDLYANNYNDISVKSGGIIYQIYLKYGVTRTADGLYIDLNELIKIKNKLINNVKMHIKPMHIKPLLNNSEVNDLGYFIYCGGGLFIRLDSEFNEKDGDTKWLKRLSYMEYVIKVLLE
jgi:hypothetical protein